MRDSNLEFRIVDPGPSNFGYAAIISLESGLLNLRCKTTCGMFEQKLIIWIRTGGALTGKKY